MSKHTAGPWVIREGATSISVVGANGEVLYHESDKRLPGVIEDARLIAAVLDLLEACIYAQAYADAHTKKILIAAIAKAKGEQTESVPEREPDYWLGYGLQAYTEKPFDGATPVWTSPLK